MQLCAEFCSLVHLDADWSGLVYVGSVWRRLVHACGDWCIFVQLGGLERVCVKSVFWFTLVQIIAVWCGLARLSACCCMVVMSLVHFDLSMLQLKNHLLLVKLSVVTSSRS